MEQSQSSNNSLPRMDTQVRIGLLSGWLLITVVGIGFVGGGYIPPAGPATPIGEVATMYKQGSDLNRLSVILIIAGGSMFIPFGAAIADRLRQIKGVRSFPIYAEIGAATASGTLMMTFGSFLMLALLRQDMPDASYQLLHDLTWIAWIGLWQPGALQAAATAVAILSDRSNNPVFPRWIGWFSAWMAIGSLMGSLIPFLVEGPFAWDGEVGFFLAGAVFFGWFIVLLWALHDVARRELRGELVEI